MNRRQITLAFVALFVVPPIVLQPVQPVLVAQPAGGVER